MKRSRFLVALAVLIVLTLTGATASMAYAADIDLEPTSGFAVVTITGTDFSDIDDYPLHISWDTQEIHGIYDEYWVVEDYYITAIIAVPTQTSPGDHQIRVWQEVENETIAEGYATFTVIDMRGPEGVGGADGEDGEQGPVGPEGPAGADGATGSAGPAGPEGPQGEEGPVGPQGPEGPQGPQGEPGPAGDVPTAGIIGAIVMAILALGLTAFSWIKGLIMG